MCACHIKFTQLSMGVAQSVKHPFYVKIAFYVKITFYVQDVTTCAQGANISKLKLRFNFCIPVSANPQTPTHPSMGFLIPNKVDNVALSSQTFSICLFLILYSLSYKSFLPSAAFCSSPQDTDHFMKC